MNKNIVTLKISAGRPDQILRDGTPHIAFSGRSNVGKSSALNRLLGRKSLARTSSSPGKTVTINFFSVDNTLYLVDLPGYGFARRSDAEKRAWSRLVEAYFQDRTDLALVLQLIDLKVGATEDDKTMLRFLQEEGIPFVVVATKWDKLNKTNQKKHLSALEEFVFPTPVFPLSSATGYGSDALWSFLQNVATSAR